MRHRTTRIALLVLCLLICASLVAWIVRHGDAPAAAETTQAADSETEDVGGTPFDPLEGGGTPIPESGAEERAPAVDAMPVREPGPPLTAGKEVDVTVAYSAGTTSRYRVVNAVMERNRQNGQARAQRWFHGVTVTVLDAPEGEGARIRLTTDWFRVQSSQAGGFEFDFDSRSPDERMLEHPITGPLLAPWLAVLDHPIELRLGRQGSPASVKGLDAWSEAFLAAVEKGDPAATQGARSPFHEDNVIFEWAQYLFPPIGGGKMKSGEPRRIEVKDDARNGYLVLYAGNLNVTHSDGDVFRVHHVATPKLRRRSGPARDAGEAAVERANLISDADAYVASWRFDRAAGRLLDTEIDTSYQLWTSFRAGRDAGGEPAYQRFFMDIQRSVRIEFLPDDG